MKIRKTLAAAGMAVAAVTAGATPASAGAVPLPANQLCHWGSGYSPPVRVHEDGGSEYLIYPGECTPGDTWVQAFQAVAGTSAYFKYEDGVGRLYKATQFGWTSSLNYNVDVVSTRFGG